jgi:hypothetical protein
LPSLIAIGVTDAAKTDRTPAEGRTAIASMSATANHPRVRTDSTRGAEWVRVREYIGRSPRS